MYPIQCFNTARSGVKHMFGSTRIGKEWRRCHTSIFQQQCWLAALLSWPSYSILLCTRLQKYFGRGLVLNCQTKIWLGAPAWRLLSGQKQERARVQEGKDEARSIAVETGKVKIPQPSIWTAYEEDASMRSGTSVWFGRRDIFINPLCRTRCYCKATGHAATLMWEKDLV